MAETEEARKWLLKAWRDLETAYRAGQGEPPLYDVAVYHRQQAAEKAVKAFLTFHDEAYAKTHDIEVLIDTASEIDDGFANSRGRSGRIDTLRDPVSISERGICNRTGAVRIRRRVARCPERLRLRA